MSLQDEEMPALGSSVTAAQEPLKLSVQVRVLAPQDCVDPRQDEPGAATVMGERFDE